MRERVRERKEKRGKREKRKRKESKRKREYEGDRKKKSSLTIPFVQYLLAMFRFSNVSSLLQKGKKIRRRKKKRNTKDGKLVCYIFAFFLRKMFSNNFCKYCFLHCSVKCG